LPGAFGKPLISSQNGHNQKMLQQTLMPALEEFQFASLPAYSIID
jgi:hypothetical protein